MTKSAFLCAAGLCLASLSILAEGPPSEPWQTQLRQCTEFLRDKKYSQARQCFERVTQLNPRSSEAYFYLGVSAHHAGDRAAAESALRQAVKLDPRAVNASYDLGILLLEDNKPAEAATYLEKVRQIGPLSPELAINLMRAHFEAGQTDRAVGIADAADRKFGDSAEFNVAAGKLFLAERSPGRACAALKKADRLQPRDPEIALPLAEACLQSNDLPSAQSALESVEQKANGDAGYHSLLAQVHFLSGRKDDALREIKSAISLEPRNPRLLLTLARLYQKYGEQENALNALRQAAALDSRSPDIPYSMAVTYITADDNRHAIEALNRALELDPKFDRALFLLGSIYLALRNVDQADPLLTAALAAEPRNPFYHCFVGMLREVQARPADAQREFQETIALRPSYGVPHFYLGRILLQKGAQADAEAEFEKAVSLQPDLSEAYYQLALILFKRGEKEKGREAMARFRAHHESDYNDSDIVLKQLQDTVR
jgi:Flp pilus assembly protein TadD